MTLYLSKASQVESEITGLIDVLVRESVTRFLEIGSRFGGSLWRIANALPKGSRIVSVDSGRGMGGGKPGARESLRDCIAELNRTGYDAHQVTGHSQSAENVEAVRKLGPFDACFIDGDHALPGVTLDWKNYGSMSRIVAFHDVAWERPDGYSLPKDVEVPILWAKLKNQGLEYQEFIDRSTGGNMGIGLVWRNVEHSI